MNESTVTEILDAVQPNPTSITITLHPQPNLDIVCDNSSAVTSATGETSHSNLSPSSGCGDSDSLHKDSLLEVKKSLKLELTHNNNEIKSIDTGSPENEDDLSFKSPTSPRTCKRRHVNSDLLEILACSLSYSYSYSNSSSQPFRSPSDITYVPSRSRRRSESASRCSLPRNFSSTS